MSAPVPESSEPSSRPALAASGADVGLSALPRALYAAGVLLALVAVLWAGRESWRYGEGSVGFDFYQFWVVSQAVSEDLVDDVYADGERRAMGAHFARRAAELPPRSRWARVAKQRTFIKTWSTPFLYAAFSPLAEGAYGRDHRRFQRLSLVCGAAGAFFFAHLAGLGLLPALLVVAWVLARWFPVQADVLVSNVNQIQLAWLAAAVWFAGGRGRLALFTGGALFGVLAAFKPNLALAVAVLGAVEIARGRWGRLRVGVAGFGAGVGAAVLLSLAFFGSLRPWGSWIAFLRSALFDQRAMTVAEHGNFALDRLAFERWGYHPGSALLVLLLGILAWVLTRERRGLSSAAGPEQPRRDTLWAVASGLSLGLIAAPLTFVHYYLLGLPAILLLIGRPPGAGWTRQVWRALGLFGLLVFGAPAAAWSWLGVTADGPSFLVGMYGLVTLAVWGALLLMRPFTRRRGWA